MQKWGGLSALGYIGNCFFVVSQCTRSMNTLQIKGGANGEPIQISFDPTMLASRKGRGGGTAKKGQGAEKRAREKETRQKNRGKQHQENKEGKEADKEGTENKEGTEQSTKKKRGIRRSEEQRNIDYGIRMQEIYTHHSELYNYLTINPAQNEKAWWKDHIVVWYKDDNRNVVHLAKEDAKWEAVNFWVKVASVRHYSQGMKFIDKTSNNQEEKVMFEIIYPPPGSTRSGYMIFPRKPKDTSSSAPSSQGPQKAQKDDEVPIAPTEDKNLQLKRQHVSWFK